ncbi:type II secretion system protein [Fontivita pretiosa]|uniref:type II secretion system protein n=1 Tax=Fontivita pretiosa TaxID=2989684 RepID=UPI003D16716B
MDRRALTALRSPAFTLVELLVVIGIIAVLISVLLPALGRARASAQAVTCRSNLRQLVLATTMFANEHDGYLPKPGNNGGPRMLGWSTVAGPSWGYKDPMWGFEYVLLKYLGRNKDVFRCPADDSGAIRYVWNDNMPNLPDKPDADNVYASYRMNWSNEFYEGAKDPRGNYNATLFISPKLGQIKPASAAILYADGVASRYDINPAPNAENHVYCQTDSHQFTISPTNAWNIAYRRHSRTLDRINDPTGLKRGLANYAFADGHVETLTWTETWKSLGDGKVPWQVTGTFLKRF